MALEGFGAFEVGQISKEDVRKAAIIICGRSKNKKDARHLMMALGIIPTPDAKPVHHVVKLGPVSTRKYRKGSTG